MPQQRSSYWLLCAATILLSAFLLFQVQPMISKIILPWFGGGPGVWTTCMLFFQIVLLLGYAYAHFLFRIPNPQTVAIIHGLLLTAALITLPINPSDVWKPVGSEQPTFKILTLLGAKVGLPYFLLASTGPLVQAWFARIMIGVSPYRLYAISNIGSLAGLLTYPFVFEPRFSTDGQGMLWSGGFALFAVVCGGLAIITALTNRSMSESGKAVSAKLKDTEDSLVETHVSIVDRLLWVLLPALGSVMLLAVTHHVCQDVAVTPFLWVAPLSLYLLSFIICFDNERWYVRPLFALLVVISIFVLSVDMTSNSVNNFLIDAQNKLNGVPGAEFVIERLLKLNTQIEDRFDEIQIEAGANLAMLFVICMLCHGELVRRKPASQYLTSFYLMTSAGGALGGIVVGLVCPLVFPENWEFNIGLVVSLIAASTVMIECISSIRGGERWFVAIPSWSVIFAIMLFVVYAQFQAVHRNYVFIARNFYGLLRVNDEVGYRALYNGRILHGLQTHDEDLRRIPNSYYDEDSGIGVVMRRYNSNEPLRLAVVGLGTGTMATYVPEGGYIRFYEINPKVEEIANDYFSFLRDCPGKVEIALGDARLSMERESPNNYDVIVLDAFSGDAIPAHLLTKEAVEIYRRHLKPEGVLAIHISNRYLELTPVVDGLAKHFGMRAFKVDNPEGDEMTDAASDWMLLTTNQQLINDSVFSQATQDYSGEMRDIPLWTDQFSNLLQILK